MSRSANPPMEFQKLTNISSKTVKLNRKFLQGQDDKMTWATIQFVLGIDFIILSKAFLIH